MKPVLLLVLLGALSSNSSSSQTCAGPMSVLPSSGWITYASGVSDDGSVVVGTDISPPTFQSFRWTAAAGAQSIGDGSATGVSGDGSVVVGYSGGAAFRWSAAGGRQIITGGEAFGVNGDGSVVVGSSDHAFRWTAAGGIQDIGPGVAYGVSADGSVVVGESSGRAFRWTAAGGMQDLGPGSAVSVNDDGTVAVGSSGGRAVRWTAAGGMQDLGPGGARDVNGDGSVVVGSDGTNRAFRWTATEGARAIPSMLVPQGVSADGSVVVGVGASGGGAVRVQLSVLGETYCRPTIANSSGCGGVVLATGDPRLATGRLELTAALLPRDCFGFFLTSRTQDFVAAAGGSQGNLCLGGSIGRFVGSGQIMDSGVNGTFSLTVDLNAVPAPTLTGTVAVQPGDTWNFQAWHRDTNPGPTSNFTDAVSVTFQ
ncbi:MAG: hypothetical protein R3F49_07830 [Planctomycetota bacterium]